jgi:cellulose synthase/poly-beta-1,6-N-acetylglucosamine synthase-like glycosyltransferase/peptidoglycan/xylan/chitin deacetylase (PgdA/CDA1 family)
VTIETLWRRRRRSEAARALGRRIERPPAHWALLALFVSAIFLLLVAEGLTEHRTGDSGTGAVVQERRVLEDGETVLGFEDGRLVAKPIDATRRIALTFDDGPDSRWTPRIAATLKRLGVPATFFVVGERVVRHPEVVRELHEDGFGIGNHTFNHSQLVGGADWQRGLQLSLTESALAGAAGIRPRLVRPPYSATPNAVGPREGKAFRAIAKRGYLIVLSDIDSEDWRRPGAAEIVRHATPPGERGGIVLMHDGGADRSQTLRAVRRLVPALQARGFQFVSMARLLGTTRARLEPSASEGESVRGDLLLVTLGIAGLATTVLTALLIPLAALTVLRAVIVVALARRQRARRRRSAHPIGFSPPVSVVVPAYNEAAGIERAVRSLAASDYPELEVIVVDDGSDDGTGEIVEQLGLARVRVLREVNRGKAEALNLGLAFARHQIIVAVDADTVFEPDAVRRLVAPFANPRVGAAAGNAKVGNRRGMLGRWQHVDYVTGFNLDRRLYDVLGCMPTVPGAIGAFRKEALESVGGFSSDTLAEDTDLTIALGREGWKVVYVEDARGFTETPATLGALWRQRYRWSFGTMQSVWKHRAAILRPSGGSVGTVGLPYLIAFQIALPLLAPLIDLFAIYGVLFLDPLPVLAYWAGFNLLMLAMAAYAFHLDRESPRVLWALPLQQFVYRQLMYLVVIQSIASAFQGARLRWGHAERSGDVEIVPR